MYLRHYYNIIIGLLVTLSTSAQQITVTELPTQKSLPTAHIHRIFQDSEGYMWYATEGGGLCRDNGYQIEVFRSDLNTPNLLSSNNITCITESQDHKIWFGTERGLYILDKNNYQITPLQEKELEGKKIHAIKATKADSSIWVAAGQKIYRYTPQTNRLNTYLSLWKTTSKDVTEFFEDSHHTLWALQWQGGILQYNHEKDEFISAPWTCSTHPVQMIEDANRQAYWIATWGQGVVRYTPFRNSSQKTYDLQPATWDTTTHNPHQAQCLGLLQDSHQGLIWVVTMDNLYAYHIYNDQLQPVYTGSFLPERKKILDQIIEDQMGNIWIPGYSPHSFILSFEKNKIHRYPIPATSARTGYPVIADAVIKDGEYHWIWQGRTGLSLYHPTSGQLSLASDFPQGAGRYRISKIMEKCRNNQGIWMACYDTRVLHMQHKGMNMEIIEEIKLPGTDNIRALHENHQGKLYIGTANSLYQYNITESKLSKLCDNEGIIINDLVAYSNETIYYATESNGLAYLTSDGHVRSIRTNENYSSVTISPDGTIWTATRQGNVYSYQPKDGILVLEKNACNMNGDAIKAIRADNSGHLWIMADQYVKEYNPRNQSSKTLYNSDHSINVDYFLSLYKEEDGNICLGGIGAYCIISPSIELDQSPVLVKPVITSIKIDGKQQLTGMNEKLLELEPGNTNLEISFSTLQHLYARKINYAYRLKGLDTTWNYLPQGANTTYFTKLPKGTYSLEIKATDIHGCWSRPITCLQLYRLPAWYETWWAYTLYILSGIILLTGVLQLYFNHMHKKQTALLEQQLTHMKFRFFTNISHEFRTPLTLIITPLGSLLASMQDGKLKQQLLSVYRNAQELLQLVNQLLDFRKLEMGGEKLVLMNGEINKFIGSACEAFQPAADSKRIKLSFHALQEPLYMHFDRNKMHRIIYNLLSNAFKFTSSGGSVTLSLQIIIRDEARQLCMSIKDSGEGIEESAIPHIFDRYYQAISNGESGMGSGIGLHIVKEYVSMHQGIIEVDSIKEQGTEFRIFIPIVMSNELSASTKSKEENKKTDEEVIGNDRKTILVVEDNEEFRKFIVHQLTEKYNIWEASNGNEAEKLAKEKEIDLVVSDVMMPGMSGFELCTRLKQDIKTSHIFIILLTARTGDESELEGYKSGADCYLTKPFNMDILINRIAHLITLQEKRKQIFLEGIEIPAENITSSKVDEEFLLKAVATIEKNIGNSEYSIELFSDDMCMSRMSLYRKLQSITGQKPTEFIRSIRLKQAARLLKSNNLTIVEVSEKVGFSTPSYFSKCFKEMFGVLPTQFEPKEENKVGRKGE